MSCDSVFPLVLSSTLLTYFSWLFPVSPHWPPHLFLHSISLRALSPSFPLSFPICSHLLLGCKQPCESNGQTSSSCRKIPQVWLSWKSFSISSLSFFACIWWQICHLPLYIQSILSSHLSTAQLTPPSSVCFVKRMMTAKPHPSN